MNEIEKIFAYSHQNIRCTHGTTIEITKDSDLTIRGTCVLGLKASKACADLNENLRTLLLKGKMIEVVIILDDLVDRFYGHGNKNLSLLNEKDIVFRKSNYICDRTILVNCTKASSDLNRDLINRLKVPGKKFSITFKNAG